MDVPAKGQVGGIESDDATRRRLAGDSRGWRCAACGRGNVEILEEQEKLAKEAEDGGKREEEKVPEELRLVYKEELKGKGKTEAVDSTPAVETVASSTPAPVPATSSQVTASPPPAPRLATVQPVRQQQTTRQRPNGHADDVQLDAAIWVVSGILVILISRMLVKMFS